MDILELDKRAEELRENKRNGRATKASQRNDANDLDAGATSRPGFETARRDLGIKPGSDLQTTDSDRSLAGSTTSSGEESGGLRRSGRRSGPNNRSTVTSSTEQPKSVGRLEPEGEVPLRVDQPEPTFNQGPDLGEILASNPKISARDLGKKLGVSHETARKLRADYEATHPKEEEQTQRPNFFKTGNTLTKQECEELYDPFLQSLDDIFTGIDKWLWTRQKNAGKDSDEAPVWSNFSEKEYERFAKLAFRHGQKNPLVASSVRLTTEAGDYIAVAGMLAPRFMQTVEIYRETRKPRAGRRGQNVNQD